MKKMLAVALLALIAGPALAMDFPATDSTDYEPYRERLVADGWMPIANGIADSDGFPEVVCGSATCSADWIAPDGSEASLTLLPQCAGEKVDGLISLCESAGVTLPPRQ